MKPFANATETTTLGELTVENRTDRIELYGSLSITRDKAGLKRARELQALLKRAIKVLEAEELPEQIQEEATTQVTNPFAD
jgi:hypothetical protein